MIRRKFIAARFWLMVYVACIMGITFIHAPVHLALLLGLAVIVSGRHRCDYLRRAITSVLLFNLAISAGYALMAWWQGRFSVDYLLLINLRVVLMLYMGFWFVHRVSILDALRGWPTATLLATLTIGQAKAFARTLSNFRSAFESRNIARPRWIDRCRHASSQAETLLDKSFAVSSELTQTMRSRGAFDD